MRTDVVILLRGPDAKSRLGTARGGSLSDGARAELIRALVRDVADCARSAAAFEQVWAGVPRGNAAFVEQLGIQALVLDGSDVNAQIRSASRIMARRADAYLLIGIDLPMLTAGYLRELVRNARELYGSQGRGVVFGLSRHLGAAAVICAPPDVFAVQLGCGPTYSANRKVLIEMRVPYRVVIGLEGYFDLDSPADLYELALMHTDGVHIPGAWVRSWLAGHARNIALGDNGAKNG